MSEHAFRQSVEAARVEVVDAAIGRAADAATEAVAVVAELMRGAESESVRLRAACALLDLIGERGSDPLKDAIRGSTTFSGAQVTDLVKRLAAVALSHVPDERAEGLLNELEASLSPR